MITYAIGYLVLGLAVVFLQRWVARANPSLQDKVSEMEAVARRHIESAQYPDGVPLSVSSPRIIGDALGFIIGVVAWPVVAFRLLQRLKGENSDDSDVPTDAEEMGEFLREVTLEEVERIELVSSTGAPNLPFGYLNSLWLNFKVQVKPGDTLWQYRYVPYEGQPLDAWRREAEGYAIMRNGVVIAKIFSNASQ
jgi:hypothetical protein